MFGRVWERSRRVWVPASHIAPFPRVFADIRCRSLLDPMGSRDKRQPNRKLLLPGTTVGEKKNFVWKEPRVDLPQQFTSVLGRGITGNEDLFRLCQSKIESGNKGWYCVGF